MGLRAELESEVADFFGNKWKQRDGTVVPTETSITLANDAVNINATVLYADLADSTKLVDGYKNWFAAEAYKAFLRCAAKIISSEDGSITAYDGDRVMAVFIGEMKNTRAVKAALRINWARQFIIQPAIDAEYPGNTYKMRHVVGVDTSNLFVAKAGFRGANDLIWIGRAANYAAKLAAMSDEYPTWITDAVYKKLADEAKFSKGVDMWEERVWTTMNNMSIYRSTYHWGIA